MQLEQDLKEVITKNLPQAAGELLQQRLAQADKDAVKVAQLSADLDVSRTRHSDALNKIHTLEAQLAAHAELAKREEAVATRERDAELKEVKAQLAASQENTKFARDVALGLVRNVEYRKTVHEGESLQQPYTPPGGGYPVNANVTNSRTTSTTDSAT